MKTSQGFPAGNFSTWLKQIRNTQKNNTGMDVPCGECTACCTSSFFIHIKPKEKKTINRIPKELLFPAPGLPKGNVLMGYDKNGHCPMFVNSACSIYDDRPLTCRNYDCRIFPATSINESEKEISQISQQAEKWMFDYSNENDLSNQLAIKSAAIFIKENAKLFPSGFLPLNSTQLAIFVLKIYPVFSEGKSLSDTEKIVNEIVDAV
ncbi:MAG: YkgJ family cysteine cluster protein [Calditrichaeota bacterium]|nr:MAG: YkgJ family cysteine cluster protein [Calditrichota bacterium]MBL1207751.1 YkgJ family cysteine cluster protein [Calditrichota bacterium]NOG47585.1 YkgJ family cysteine cluster protein [Calditrichota bacterium]